MNTRHILVLTLLGASGILRVGAQLLPDGTSRTLSNETNTITGTVTVGTNGAFTLLVLSDNALLTNSAHGVVGFTARSNEVRLVSPSARWFMGGNLFVGSNGAMNRLVVSNGAFLENNDGVLGSRLDSSNNLALVTGAGSVWSNRNDITVGTLGRNNQIIVSNGGWVASRNGRLGGNTSGSNNVVVVTGTGSVWSNALSVAVGNSAPGKLVIDAGGLVHDDSGTVGGFSSASNSEALVTGPGSRWNNTSSLTIGNNVGRNRLVVSNGAAVWSGTGLLGGTSAASSNQVVVTGAGSVWSNQTFLFLGSTGNRVDVSDGGWLACNDGSIGPAFGANSNTVVLTGSGSGWNTLAGLIVGQGGNGNVLIASNSATVWSSNATIGVNGSTANNNLAAITGPGTLWSNRSDLVVGSSGVGNRLQVDNGATLLSGNLFVGFNSLSANNRVTVDGGALRVTNLAGNGTLDIRRGTNVLSAGLIEADRLLVTNTGGRFVFNGGTLAVGQSTIAGSLSFDVGDGVRPATLHLTGNGTHSFFIFRSNARLIGNGTNLLGMVLMAGSTLSPGNAPGNIGRVVSTDSVPLAGTSIMEISKSGSVLTNDQLQVANTITYVNNSLVVVSNIGPTALTAGDRFQLFPAASYAALFLPAVTLPPLPPGLVWTNKLLVDGSIEVAGLSAQTLPASAIGSTTATLNGVANPGGNSASAWFEWGTTTNYGNVTAPKALGDGTSTTNFSEVLACLTAGVIHHFRAVASNSLGVAFGTNQSFTTLPMPSGLAYLKASNTKAVLAGFADQFGFSVAMSGDTVVIGSPGEDSNATGVNGDQTNNNAVGSGAAYVFVHSGDCWVQQTYLKASNTGAADLFGNSVAISGDTLVVGARSEASSATGVNGNGANDSAPSAGAAYIFVRNGTNWTQQAYLKASNTDSNDLFGSSVTISGDTVLVGAPQEDSAVTGVNGNGNDNSAADAGAAYVFVRNGTNWTQQAYLKPSNTAPGDMFGLSLEVSGDTAVIGSRFQDSVATNSGAAYVFERNGTNWAQHAMLKASNADADDEFGRRVALSGDTVVVGAALEDSSATGVNGNEGNNSATDSGAAYVFVRSGTNWIQQAYLKASNTGPGDNFGQGAVAISGDTVVVGAIGEDSAAMGVNGEQINSAAAESGAAYFFMRDGTNWTQQAYLKSSNTGAGDRFGVWVAAAGSTVVVGADLEDSLAKGVNGNGSDNSAGNSGAAYVYDLSLLNSPTPVLSIAQSGVSQVTISWTPPTPGFTLQESLDLTAMSWSNSPSGSTNPITLPVTGPTKFFRLSKP